MIILLIILFAALIVVGFFYIKNKLLSWLVGVLSVLLLALSMAALVYHDNYHWGMRQVTTTSTQQIYSIGGSTQAFGTLIRQEIGTKSGNYLFIYKTSTEATTATANFLDNTKTIDMTNSASAKSLQTFVEEKITSNIVETSKKSATYQLVDADKAQLVTKTTRWEFSSDFMKTLFAIGGESGELVKQQSLVEVPKDSWLVLTTAQAQELKAKAPEMQAQAQAAQAQLEAAIAAAPTAEVRAALEAKTKAAMAPAAQMDQVKQLLGITG